MEEEHLMPKWLHDKLAKAGRKRGLKGDKLKAYIYSVLDNYKKKKPRKRTAKGRRLAKP